MASLGEGLDALSSSIAGCDVQQVQQKLDALALAIKWAKIKTKGLDNTVKVLVGASDLWKVIKNAASAAKSGDSDNIATLVAFGRGSKLPAAAKVTRLSMVDGIIRDPTSW